MKFIVLLISLFLCPIANLRATWHQLRTGYGISVYAYNFRFLMFCSNCHKVFVNELTQEEVDQLEIFDNPWEDDE